MNKKVLAVTIEGMRCGLCVDLVKNILEGVSGISSVSVELSSGIAVIEASDTVKYDNIKLVIEDAGYEVVSIEEA